MGLKIDDPTIDAKHGFEEAVAVEKPSICCVDVSVFKRNRRFAINRNVTHRRFCHVSACFFENGLSCTDVVTCIFALYHGDFVDQPRLTPERCLARIFFDAVDWVSEIIERQRGADAFPFASARVPNG